MKTSALIIRTSVHHFKPTMISYHPPTIKGYHYRAWRIGDLRATSELGPPIPQPPLLVPYIFSLVLDRVSSQVFSARVMARKATGKRPAPQDPEDPPGRRPSKDMKRAAETARAYKQGTSSQVQ